MPKIAGFIIVINEVTDAHLDAPTLCDALVLRDTFLDLLDLVACGPHIIRVDVLAIVAKYIALAAFPVLVEDALLHAPDLVNISAGGTHLPAANKIVGRDGGDKKKDTDGWHNQGSKLKCMV
jgi:hypothetical protein